MIILRVFLISICAVSIGWSVLVFGGPVIIKKFILGYSDGALVPSGITVSPRLDIAIKRLEFNLKNEKAGQHIEGFSRATEISWSLFGKKPFLEISLGQSLVKDYATADSIKFHTPPFQTIDWQNVAVIANIENVTANTFAKISALTLRATVNIKTAKVSNLDIQANDFSASDGKTGFAASFIKSDLSELSLNANLTDQLLLSTYTLTDIVISEPNFTAPEATIDVSMTEKARNFKIDLHKVKILEFDGQIQDLKFDGSFNQFNVLQELSVVFVDGFFSKQLPKFHEISANVKKLGDTRYRANIEGSLQDFELSKFESLIGQLPGIDFVIEVELDKLVSKLTSTSKIDFSTLSKADINGALELTFAFDPLQNSSCGFTDCRLSDFDLGYIINVDDEWLKGNAYCLKSLCGLSELEYLMRTSNTVNIFTILNQANILNPLSSLYLFSAVSSGQKMIDGHELKFQF